MDITFVRNQIAFIWNKKKEEENPSKHELYFERATEAFIDPFLILVDASRNFEERDAIIGRDFSDRLLFVVHIQIDDDNFRLISARKATRLERNEYENRYA